MYNKKDFLVCIDIAYCISELNHSISRRNNFSSAINEDYEFKRFVEREFAILGEAVKKLSDDFKNEYNNIPWSEISGTRDFVNHEYNTIDYEILEIAYYNELDNVLSSCTNYLSNQGLTVSDIEKIRFDKSKEFIKTELLRAIEVISTD